MIAGSGSHSGKTTVSCGLLEAFRHRGLSVAAYKTGPDYIDPQFLRRSGKCETYNLDTWLMSEQRTCELFARTSAEKDIAVIEGAMGLYDGGPFVSASSTASIAKLLHAPVILVMDVKSLGESAAAVALGFREYDSDVNFARVILNRTGSSYHAKIIADELSRLGIKCFGELRRDDGLGVPERHLGLVPVSEGAEYDSERLRLAVEDGINLDEVLMVSELHTLPDTATLYTSPDTATLQSPDDTATFHSLPDTATLLTHSPKIRPSAKVSIGVAHDEAFSFYYPESLGILEELGAELVYFSPIHDSMLPKAEGYIFGGGFPEMFASELSGNALMLDSVRKNIKPVLAECGGYMYLCRSLRNFSGNVYGMAGVIPADAVMTDKPILGYMEAETLRDNILCESGRVIRGHEFHYSRIEPEFFGDFCAFSLTRRNINTSHFGGYVHGKILASYLHINFFGYPELAMSFVKSCAEL